MEKVNAHHPLLANPVTSCGQAIPVSPDPNPAAAVTSSGVDNLMCDWVGKRNPPVEMENEVGSIVPGKLAYFTILAENPVTCDPKKLKDIKVRGTIHEGRVFPVNQPGGLSAKVDLREPLNVIASLPPSVVDMHVHDGGECACAMGSRLAAMLYPDDARDGEGRLVR